MALSNMNYWLLLWEVLLSACYCFGSPIPNETERLKSENVGGYIVIAGGRDFFDNDRKSVFLLNTGTRKWSSIAELPVANEGSQLFYTDGKLLSAGGSDQASFLMYSSSAPTWTLLPDLNQATGWGVCGAILDGSLYLIGGLVNGSATQVMNPFNFPTWTPGANLQQARHGCGAATMGSNIYTCGNAYTDDSGRTCEKYDQTTNSWSFIASMNDYRWGQILVALNGYLYAVGGNNVGTAERYDPATNAWTYIQPVNDRARLVSVATTDGKLIYLVGGCDGTDACGSGGTEINTVEVYIPELDEWVLIPPLPEAREYPAIAYLPELII